jgi:hypothetical protein
VSTTAPNPRTAAMTEGRRADTARRRQRVIKALNDAATRSEDLSVTAIARTASVDRTFLYRHRDLLAQLHTMATQRSSGASTQRPAALHCRPTCSPPSNALSGSTHESANSNNAYPNSLASRPGMSPASAPPTTSTRSNNALST